ncbi:MAG: TraB/GumN family protein [Caulobacterales bacterium]
MSAVFRKAVRTPLACLCAALSLTALSACDSVPAAEIGPRPAMFKLSDADSEIYLFGTVHILPRELVWRTAKFDAAFAKARTIYFETPGGPDSEARAMVLTQRLGVNPPGVTLDAYLDEAERKRLRKVAIKAGLQAENLQSMRPWLAAIMLSLNAMVIHGQDPNSGVEKILEAEAARSGKTLAYFETIDEQLGLFAKLSDASQKAVLLASLDDVEQGDALTQKLDRAWAQGDLKTLDKYVNSDLRKLDMNVYRAILADRNANWARQIDTLMKADQRGATIFIAVGAGHLAGTDSVPALLASMGYKIERAQ